MSNPPENVVAPPTIPEMVFLELRFRTLVSITNIPHFHGAHWKAMFHHALRSSIPEGKSLHSEGFSIIPTDIGVTSYYAAEEISLGLSFPSSVAL